jgi:Natural resistance-associated macrophage protein
MGGFLYVRAPVWLRTLVTRGVALIPAVLVATVASGGNAMDTLQGHLNVLQSFQLPFALVPVLYITTRSDVMGCHRVQSVFKWVVFGIGAALLGVNGATAVTEVRNVAESVATGVLAGVGLALYALFVVYLLIGPRTVRRVLVKLDNRVAWAWAGWLAEQGESLNNGEVELGDAPELRISSSSSECAADPARV